MNTTVKTLFTNALRNYTGNQVSGAEYVNSGVLEGYDAFGLLCVLHMAQSHSPVSFVPSRLEPCEFYYYPRMAMLAWSGLTAGELTDLIDMSDADGCSFADIANAIDEEWK